MRLASSHSNTAPNEEGNGNEEGNHPNSDSHTNPNYIYCTGYYIIDS